MGPRAIRYVRLAFVFITSKASSERKKLLARPQKSRLACNRTMPPAASVAELRAVRARLAELTERSMIGRNNQRGHATEVRLRLVGQHKTGTSSNQPGRRNSETAQASKSNRMRAQARRIEEMASQGAGASARFRPRAVDLSAAGSRRSAQGRKNRIRAALSLLIRSGRNQATISMVYTLLPIRLMHSMSLAKASATGAA